MAKTYYHRATALATGVHSATHELAQATTAGGTATAMTQTLGGGVSVLAFCFTTPAGEPNSADWPSGTYRCILEVNLAGADISYGLRAAGTATGHFARVDAALTVDREAVAQAEGLFTGTGIKMATVSWNPAAGAADDRFECLVAATRAASHGNQDLTIIVDAPDASAANGGVSDGPWPSAIVVTIGQALEADLSQAVGRLKQRTALQALETDVAQPLVLPKVVAVLQVVETDLAQAAGRLKAKLIGQALETDLAQPVRRNPLSRLIGMAVETDLAQAVTAVVGGGVLFRIRGLMRRR